MAPRLASFCLAAALLGGCGDDAAAPDAPDADHGASEFQVSNTDSSGDSHSVTIRCSDLLSELPVTLITDGAHAHSLLLKVEDLQMILSGMTVELAFTDGHPHIFSIAKPMDACTGY